MAPPPMLVLTPYGVADLHQYFAVQQLYQTTRRHITVHSYHHQSHKCQLLLLFISPIILKSILLSIQLSSSDTTVCLSN